MHILCHGRKPPPTPTIPTRLLLPHLQSYFTPIARLPWRPVVPFLLPKWFFQSSQDSSSFSLSSQFYISANLSCSHVVTNCSLHTLIIRLANFELFRTCSNFFKIHTPSSPSETRVIYPKCSLECNRHNQSWKYVFVCVFQIFILEN